MLPISRILVPLYLQNLVPLLLHPLLGHSDYSNPAIGHTIYIIHQENKLRERCKSNQSVMTPKHTVKNSKV